MSMANNSDVLLQQIEEHAGDHPELKNVASVLREVCSTLRDLQEQVAGRVKEFYTVDEVATMVGRAPYTIRSWIGGGKIRADRVEAGSTEIQPPTGRPRARSASCQNG